MILHNVHLNRWIAAATEWMAIVMLGNSPKKQNGQWICKSIELNHFCAIAFFPKVQKEKSEQQLKS
jgi:hypothetical protein